ncbi:Hypothetical protein CAP_5486 [Chondromyces apiculatus DSM 436]|uniref:Uncharacterized protein n=1 Tax=Chondromyces apiculatus DSM 436 TaxID=1192034 RepID=A0A017T3E2_9BACT|nr:Hypothetical protein CAP_5486 [Chondromyces apiculatus DSM 436]
MLRYPLPASAASGERHALHVRISTPPTTAQPPQKIPSIQERRSTQWRNPDQRRASPACVLG